MKLLKKTKAILFIIAMLLVITGCSDKKDDDRDNEKATKRTEKTTESTTKATEKATKDDSTNNTSAATDTTEAATKETEATADVTTTEATTKDTSASVPYAEEMGLVFSGTIDTELPFLLYFEDYLGNITDTADGYTMPKEKVSYKLLDVWQSEPDENGYVTVIIPYTTHAVFHDIPNMDYTFGYMWSSVWVFDYYTGEVPPYADTIIDDTSTGGFDYSAEFTYDGVTYDISYMKTALRAPWDWEVKELPDGDIDVYTDDYTDFSIILRIPKDYDGLCLYLPTTGITEYREMSGVVDDSVIYKLLDPERTAPEVLTAEDYILVRVRDLLN